MADGRDRYELCVIGGGIVGTHIGRLFARGGRRVVILERGPRNLSGIRAPSPEVVCSERQHGGMRNARNHVLGGNGHFWGGGLIRPSECTVEHVLGIANDDSTEDLTADFRSAERAMGLRHSLSRAPLSRTVEGLGPCSVAQIAVMPGRGRNVAAHALQEFESTSLARVYCDVDQLKFARTGNRVTRASFTSSGASTEIEADEFVIAAGAVDSNLIVAAHRQDLGMAPGVEIGGPVHDHWSLPLFSMKTRGSADFLRAIAPTFENGVIVGQHFELEAGRGWGARGFIHFQFHFDEASPYREVKSLLALRQQRAGIGALAVAALRLVPSAGSMVRIGISRFFENRLYLSDLVPIVATLDFETSPSIDNRFAETKSGPRLHWDVRADDAASFEGLVDRGSRLVGDFCKRYGVTAAPVADWSTPERAEAYLRRSATDAYHLGGGLNAGADEHSAVDLDLKLRGSENVFVISSAVFRRPGVVNPTLSLLAIASRFARQRISQA